MLACRDTIIAQLGNHCDVKIAGPNKESKTGDEDDAVKGLLATAVQAQNEETKGANKESMKKASDIAEGIMNDLREISAYNHYPQGVKNQLMELQFTNVTEHMSPAMKKMVKIMLNLSKDISKQHQDELEAAPATTKTQVSGGSAIAVAPGQSQGMVSSQDIVSQSAAMQGVAEAIQGLAAVQKSANAALKKIATAQQKADMRLAALESMVFNNATLDNGRGKRSVGIGEPSHQSADVQ